jgi:lysophospholipase L1-like esterase
VKINKRGILTNLALVIFSTALAFFITELALRLMGWDPMYVSPERAHFWKYDSQLGWANQPGQEGVFQTPQFRTTVHVNQKGLRDSNHTYDRANNTGRILVLGDSFAWGYGVEEAQRFSQVLQTSMGVEVINAGVSGYSTDQELLWYRSEGVKYNPDLLILVFTGNDIGDNEQQLVYTIYYKPQFVIEDGQPILKNTPVPQTGTRSKIIYDLCQRSSLFYFLVQRFFDFRSIYKNFSVRSANASPLVSAQSPKREPFELTISLLHEISKIAEGEGARFMIVATDHWWNGPSGETYQDFIDTLRTEEFLVLDVERMPGFDPAKMVIPDDGHWNPAGHEFVAQKIGDFIENNQLLTHP